MVEKGKEKLAFGIQWHITTDCINHCKHCYMFHEEYVSENCSFKDFETMFFNIQAFEDKYHVEIPLYVLTGGSPLLNPDCGHILRFLAKQNKEIKLLDIPEMVTEENIALLKEVSVVDFQVSLDGLEETHDDIRGAGSFQRTIEALRKLGEEGFFPNIMYTLSPENKNELIPLCRYLQKEVKKFGFSFDFVVPIGNAKEEKKGYFTSEQAKEIMDAYYAFSHAFTAREQVFSLKPSQYRSYGYIQRGKALDTIYDYPMVAGCHIGWKGICILQNGDVLPCRRLPLILGNLKRESFEEILLQSALLKKIRRFSIYQEECGSCAYGKACRGCPAIAYAMTGNPFGKFPLCSDYMEMHEKKSVMIPAIECDNETEMQYILDTFRNRMIRDSKKLLWRYPNIKTLLKELRTLRNSEEKRAWIERIKGEVALDELYALQCFIYDNLLL